MANLKDEMRPGWLARGLDSARKEIKGWPLAKQKALFASHEFRILPMSEPEPFKKRKK